MPAPCSTHIEALAHEPQRAIAPVLPVAVHLRYSHTSLHAVRRACMQSEGYGSACATCSLYDQSCRPAYSHTSAELSLQRRVIFMREAESV